MKYKKLTLLDKRCPYCPVSWNALYSQGHALTKLYSKQVEYTLSYEYKHTYSPQFIYKHILFLVF